MLRRALAAPSNSYAGYHLLNARRAAPRGRASRAKNRSRPATRGTMPVRPLGLTSPWCRLDLASLQAHFQPRGPLMPRPPLVAVRANASCRATYAGAAEEHQTRMSRGGADSMNSMLWPLIGRGAGPGGARRSLRGLSSPHTLPHERTGRRKNISRGLVDAVQPRYSCRDLDGCDISSGLDAKGLLCLFLHRGRDSEDYNLSALNEERSPPC